MKRFVRNTICAAILAAAVSRGLTAQAPVRDTLCVQHQLSYGGPGTAIFDYERVAELAGVLPLKPLLIRRESDPRPVLPCSADRFTPWFSAMPRRDISTATLELMPVTSSSFYNSAYPVDRNNGAIWAGRGASEALTAGVRAKLGALSIAVQPAFLAEENREFDFVPVDGPGLSPFGYVWHQGVIDLPQRFGTTSINKVDPGQSYARLDVRGLVVGAGTENMWWGPGVRNSLLMSNTAPGFPHAFAGTSRPIKFPLGRIEAQLITGRLTESKYFDFNPDNDRRLFSGVIVNYEPRGLRGLYLGVARSYLETIPPDGLSPGDYLVHPFKHPSENPTGIGGDNQLIAVFGRWAIPGFEAYAEWAREDHWEDLTDFIKEPDHSQAYTFGFQRVITNPHSWLRVYGELTHLEGALPFRGGRGVVTIYTHAQITQGYTEQGQLLGAWIGPGSDSQIIGADMFRNFGSIGLYLERIRHDDDAYYTILAPRYGSHGHDVELNVGQRNVFFMKNFEVSTELAYGYRYNPRFTGLDGSSFAFRSETNLFANLKLSWKPSRKLVAQGSNN